MPYCRSSSRTLTGAWIETLRGTVTRKEPLVAPSRVRGLKPAASGMGDWANRRTLTGAWIETGMGDWANQQKNVAPSRVRGLKLFPATRASFERKSHPHGCVD